MSWTVDSGGVWTHTGTARDTVAGPGTLSGLGQVALRGSNKTGNIKAYVFGGPFDCWEAGIEGADGVIRRVNLGVPAAAADSSAHGISSSTPFTIDVRVVGTVISLFLNSDFSAPLAEYDTADDAGRDLSQQTGYGFVSAVSGAKVLSASLKDLAAIRVSAAKFLVAIGGGELWVMERPTGALSRIAGGVTAPTGPVSLTEYLGHLLVVDGAGIPKDFNALTLAITDWTQGGSPPVFKHVRSFQDRVYGVPTADPQNLYASAVSDYTDYNTGVSLPGAAFAFSLSKLPKIGEPIEGLVVTTNTAMTVLCARSIWEVRGDPALGGVAVVPISEGIGGSGKDAAVLGPQGQIIAHTTEGLCVLSGGVQHVSLPVLTEAIQVQNAIDNFRVQVLRDTARHMTMAFLSPADGTAGTHVHYDERVGQWNPGLGGFFIERYPDKIGPSASVDWDGLVVLGGNDGILRVFDNAVKNYDGEPMNWRLPLFLAQDEDLTHDVVMTELVITRGEDSDDFDILIYGGRTAEEAAVGTNRYLLLRKTVDERTKVISATVRAPALVAELVPRAYDTAMVFETAQMTYTSGELSRFPRASAAAASSFGASIVRTGGQGYTPPAGTHGNPHTPPGGPGSDIPPGTPPGIGHDETPVVTPPFLGTPPGTGTTDPDGTGTGTTSGDGWTDLRAGSKGHYVYVDSTGGDDATGTPLSFEAAGLNPSAPIASPLPYKTLAAAYTQIRDGYSDWMLLKCGKVWSETLDWKPSGWTSGVPTVLTSYGSGARPIIRAAPDQTAFSLYSVTDKIQHVAIVDIAFDCPTYDGTGSLPFGMSISGNVNDVLVEGCKFTGFFINLRSQQVDDSHRRSNISVRRNIIVDAQRPLSTGQHCQNAYFEGTDGLLIEENVIDRSGNGSAATQFRHNLYIQVGANDCTAVVVRKNVLARAWISAEMRPGGLFEKNLSLDCTSHLVAGGSAVTDTTVLSNVMIGSHDMDSASGVGINLAGNDPMGNNRFFTTDNIVSGANSSVTSTDGINALATGNVISGAAISGNIVYQWRNGSTGNAVFLGGTLSGGGLIAFADNDYQQGAHGGVYVGQTIALTLTGGRHYSGDTLCYGVADFSPVSTRAQWITAHAGDTSTFTNVTYSSPDRDAATYMNSLGLTATLAAYMTAARGNRKPNANGDTWDPRFTALPVVNYVRTGFGKPTVS